MPPIPSVMIALAGCIALPPIKSPLPKPPNHGGIYVIAHRGAHQGVPENTLAAYQKAIDLGADFVEIDVRTTKDGQFVSIHNSTVDAYTTDGTKGQVRDFTLAQIKTLDIGSRVGPQWKDERVPTFDEILQLCKDKIGIYLDLKAAPVDALVDRIQAHAMEQHIVWCVSPNQVDAIRRYCPTCIPMPDPHSEAALPATLKKTKPRVVAPVWRDFSSTFSAQCHDAGAIVFVDEDDPDPANWSVALEWGADGIQTDAPEQLIEFLKRRQKYRKADQR
jgi:glycerophosphoryl diester phosphodiesterase